MLRWFDRSEREAKVRELAKEPGAFVGSSVAVAAVQTSSGMLMSPYIDKYMVHTW